jgi:hypothetical protein
MKHLRLFCVHSMRRRNVVECGEHRELHVAASTALATLPIVAPPPPLIADHLQRELV